MLRVMFSAFWLAAVVCSSLGMTVSAQEKLIIVGSGSSLPIHLYQAWANTFNAGNDRIEVRYLPVVSSDSVRNIAAGIGDFAAGEIPLTEQQIHGSEISLLPIPTALVAIIPIYNVPGKPELNFSGELLAQIYLGSVRNWNDPRIVKLNPGVKLPDIPIQVVHRSRGKGSNFIFTDFLSKTDPEFRMQVGKSPSPSWPLGLEANRGQDMVEMVESTVGRLGYVELGYIRKASVGQGRVKNASGQFVAVSTASIESACETVENFRPNDLRFSMTNAPGKDSYPLASFTWIYVPTSGVPLVRREALKQFLLWSLQDGQKLETTLGYAPLPERIAAQALAVVASLP